MTEQDLRLRTASTDEHAGQSDARPPGLEARAEQPAAGDYSGDVYRRIQIMTGRAGAGPISLVVALLFAAAAALLLVGIKQGADLRQFLIAIIVLVVVNLVAALVWSSPAARRARGRRE